MTYKDLNDYELLSMKNDNEEASDILYKKYERRAENEEKCRQYADEDLNRERSN